MLMTMFRDSGMAVWAESSSQGFGSKTPCPVRWYDSLAPWTHLQLSNWRPCKWTCRCI